MKANVITQASVGFSYPGRYEAMLEAQRQNPHLDRTPPGMKSMRPTAARPMPSGNAEQQLNAAAKQIAAATRHITLAQRPQQTGATRG
ncbi:MAG: hypothetical protein NTY38_09535 [Acidobacteria bacterium]|nr:hypothetical protein [Acidobacteriota bacterium]